MTRPTGFRVIAGFGVAIALAGPGRTAAQRPNPVPDLLARAAAYLTDYEAKFSAVVSEERYTQDSSVWVGIAAASRHRTTRSDVIVINAGPSAWIAFRDVFEVDGKLVRDRDERLQKLFLETPGQAMVQAKRIMDESARYNLGGLQRNVNVPTMALTYLRAANQPRSGFALDGHENVNRIPAAVLTFSEIGVPTVIQSASQNLPASGRFWIEPASGRVLKTELSVRTRTLQAKITVTYAAGAKVDLWVPATMKEDYRTPRGEHITAEARYANFRQFVVLVSDHIKR
jgi:hypothetical protein